MPIEKFGRHLLLPREMRMRLRIINPRNPRHFHHLSEMHRVRLNLFHSLELQLNRQGASLQEGNSLAEKMDSDPKIKKIIYAHDDNVLAFLFSIAGIRKAGSRRHIEQLIHDPKLPHTFGLPGISPTFEIGRTLQKDAILSPEEKKAFMAAVNDWQMAGKINSDLLFEM